MPNVLILNNTENYHSGCKAVMDFFRNEFKDHNLDFEITKDRYDLVLINGEGTMHDDADRAYELLKNAINFKTTGSKIGLVNSVWQNNSSDLTAMLKFFDIVHVREIKSKKEIEKDIKNIDIEVYLDLSYFFDISGLPASKKEYSLTTGNRMNVPGVKPKRPKINNLGENHCVDIFNQSWKDLISELQKTEVFITGRHHEMYAACKAECIFLALEGNTHKNSGLFETAGVDIPILPMNASNDDISKLLTEIKLYKNEFEALFKFMKSQKKPNYERMVL